MMKEEQKLELIKADILDFLDDEIFPDQIKDLNIYEEAMKLFLKQKKFGVAKETYDMLKQEYSHLKTDDIDEKRKAYGMVKGLYDNLTVYAKSANIKVVSEKNSERAVKQDEPMKSTPAKATPVKSTPVKEKSNESKEAAPIKEPSKPSVPSTPSKKPSQKISVTAKMMPLKKSVNKALTKKDRKELKPVDELVKKEGVVKKEIVNKLLNSVNLSLNEGNLRKSVYTYVKIYELYPFLQVAEKKQLRGAILKVFIKIKLEIFKIALINMKILFKRASLSMKLSKKNISNIEVESVIEIMNIVKSLEKQTPKEFKQKEETRELLLIYDKLLDLFNKLKKSKLII